jgi:transcriptional accessory protein Tex/SPT6
VTKLIPAFAFLDLGGGIGGAIHVRNLAARRIAHPGEVVKEGELIQARVLSLDMQRKRVEMAYVGPATVATLPGPERIGVKSEPQAASAIAPPRAARASESTLASEPRRPPRERRHEEPAPRRGKASAAARSTESQGASVNEAVLRGMDHLGIADINQVQIEVLRDPVTGFLGRLKEPALVRLTVRSAP